MRAEKRALGVHASGNNTTAAGPQRTPPGQPHLSRSISLSLRFMLRVSSLSTSLASGFFFPNPKTCMMQ
jgi:hypothetical protein